MLSTLKDFRLGGVLVSRDGRRAQVDITERWESNLVNGLGVCVGHFHDNEAPQTAFLQRTANGWMIYDARHHSPAPERVACHVRDAVPAPHDGRASGLTVEADVTYCRGPLATPKAT